MVRIDSSRDCLWPRTLYTAVESGPWARTEAVIGACRLLLRCYLYPVRWNELLVLPNLYLLNHAYCISSRVLKYETQLHVLGSSLA